jgi:hypothetical protein
MVFAYAKGGMNAHALRLCPLSNPVNTLDQSAPPDRTQQQRSDKTWPSYTAQRHKPHSLCHQEAHHSPFHKSFHYLTKKVYFRKKKTRSQAWMHGEPTHKTL